MITVVLGTIAVLYLAAGAGLYFYQGRLVYFPDPRRATPGEMGLAGVDVKTLRTPDGDKGS